MMPHRIFGTLDLFVVCLPVQMQTVRKPQPISLEGLRWFVLSLWQFSSSRWLVIRWNFEIPALKFLGYECKLGVSKTCRLVGRCHNRDESRQHVWLFSEMCASFCVSCGNHIWEQNCRLHFPYFLCVQWRNESWRNTCWRRVHTSN